MFFDALHRIQNIVNQALVYQILDYELISP